MKRLILTILLLFLTTSSIFVLAATLADSFAFGSDNQGIAVLNFNPDPFDYAGFKGVLLSQYRETIQKTSIRPNIGVAVFTKDIEGAPVPIDTKIYPRYQLHDRADVERIGDRQIKKENACIGGMVGVFVIPEPLIKTFPEFGKGEFTQAITNSPIHKYYLRRFWK